MTTGADWLDQARRLLEAVRAPEPAADAPGRNGTGHASDCSWCPVCQLTAVLRGERPEVTAALADVLTTAAGALREFAADGPPPAADGPPGAADGPPGAADGPPPAADEPPGAVGDDPAGAPAPPPSVQRIDIA